MTHSFFLTDLATLGIQIAILVALATLLPMILQIRIPGFMLRYWQLILLGCLMLPVLQPWRQIHELPPDPATVGEIQATPHGAAALDVAEQKRQFRIHDILAMILAAGALFRLARLSVRLHRLHHYRQRGDQISSLPPQVRELQSRLGLRVEIFKSHSLLSPATFGLIRPCILLPECVLEMESECQTSIIAHELLHVRRKDWLFTIAEELVLALYWYHPAVWWLIDRIRLAREQVVDRGVIDLSIDRSKYLSSLVEIASFRVPGLLANMFSLASHLTSRVTAILTEVQMSTTRLMMSATILLLLLGLGGYSAIWAFPLISHNQAIGVISDAESQRRITGKVFDPTGALIRGVSISVVDDETEKVISTTETDQEGRFEVFLPTERDAKLCFEQPGFRRYVLTNERLVRVDAFNIYLDLGEIVETIEINPSTETAPSREPIRMHGNVIPPRLLHMVEPIFPPEANDLGIQDTVILQAMIDTEGRVRSQRVLRGHPLLNRAALKAVNQWRYSPALMNGESWPVQLTITLIFKSP